MANKLKCKNFQWLKYHLYEEDTHKVTMVTFLSARLQLQGFEAV